jgi:hypothetical protein
MSDANDLLMGGGVKSAKFDTIGTTVGGRIVRPPQKRQQTDFDNGKPKFYEDGEPMMQIVVHVQTDQRDPTDAADDGVRAIYLRGQLMPTVRDAVKLAGGRGLEVGGELHVTFTSTEKNSRGRGQDKKVYGARYVLPGVQAANDALMGEPAAQAAPAPSLPPLPTPVTAGGAQPIPAPVGVDPGAWAGLSVDQQRNYLAQLQGQPVG